MIELKKLSMNYEIEGERLDVLTGIDLSINSIQKPAKLRATRLGTCLKHVLQKLCITDILVETVGSKTVSVTVVMLGAGIIKVATIVSVHVARERNQ